MRTAALRMAGKAQIPFSLCILMLIMPSAGISQTVAGSITGRVVDSSRLPIAGAQVSLVNEQTRDTRKLSTDAAGDFPVGGAGALHDLGGGQRIQAPGED